MPPQRRRSADAALARACSRRAPGVCECPIDGPSALLPATRASGLGTDSPIWNHCPRRPKQGVKMAVRRPSWATSSWAFKTDAVGPKPLLPIGAIGCPQSFCNERHANGPWTSGFFWGTTGAIGAALAAVRMYRHSHKIALGGGGGGGQAARRRGLEKGLCCRPDPRCPLVSLKATPLRPLVLLW